MRRVRVVAALSLVVGLVTVASAAREFTDELWDANRDIYDAILRHPFLVQLQDGSLDRDAFVFYLVQDTHYLKAFSQALKVTARKAPRREWAALLHTHAEQTIADELVLHESIFEAHGVTPAAQARMEPAPQAFAYTSYLVATAHTGTFAEAMAALLPCYWIYWEVANGLNARGSADPTYQRWIDAYAAPDYGETVRTMRQIVDAVAATASPAERERMRANFRRSSRYEWMFWDSAFHQRRWPPVR